MSQECEVNEKGCVTKFRLETENLSLRNELASRDAKIAALEAAIEAQKDAQRVKDGLLDLAHVELGISKAQLERATADAMRKAQRRA